MFGTNRGIIEASRDRMGRGNLSALVLQHVRISSLKHSRRASAETCRMVAKLFSATACFNSNELHFLIFDELVKDADGIRSAANASNDRLRKLAFGAQNLRPRLTPSYLVEVANHRGIRMRTQHAAQQIMRRANIGDPVAHGLIDRVF